MPTVPPATSQGRTGPGAPGMHVSVVLWDLRRSDATIDDLREYLRDYAVDAYSTLKGLRLKAWVSNEERGLWGAVYLWDAPEDFAGIFTVSRAAEIIGYPPTTIGSFALEAIAEGVSEHRVLSGLGLALERGASTGQSSSWD